MPTDIVTDPDGIAPTRMRRQGMWSPIAPDVPTVLGSLVAMQGQEFPYALWALAQRVRNEDRPDREKLLALFDRGDILRTHVLRTTWHLVLPRDARWLLRLTTPRLRRQTAFYDRQLGLGRAELDRVQRVLAAEVAGGRHRTRRQLAAALTDAGIEATGQRLGHLMMHAEFDEVLISGAMSGRQQTYAAFDERVPAESVAFDAEDALADLARRYVASRAPVTAKDFASWASLTVGQARAGLEAAGCEGEELDGTVVFHPPGDRPGRPGGRRPRGSRPGPRADLLQGYDELIMSYSESRGRLTAGAGTLPVLDRTSYLHAVLIDGTLAGHWRHRLDAGTAVVQVQPIRTWSAAEHAAVSAAVAGYGRYLGCPTSLE
jgi:hypothetical protein